MALFVCLLVSDNTPTMLDVHTFVEHTTCADTGGYGYPFDCSGEAKNIILKAGTPCTGVGCNATTCCGACLRFGSVMILGFCAAGNSTGLLFAFAFVNTSATPVTTHVTFARKF